MREVNDLYREVRSRFPAMAAAADQDYRRLNDGFNPPDDRYAWFESLANALNDEMRKKIPYRIHEPLFRFMDGVALRGGEEVGRCLDVAFIENLFWNVPKQNALPYWEKLPPRLKHLYVAFHHHEP